jgi:branched-chain amino acid transport system permease protein
MNGRSTLLEVIRNYPISWEIVALLGLVLSPLVLSDFQTILLTQMIIMGLFALSLNLIMGYGGMVHFGHGAFFGIGAYTVAILLMRYHLSLWVAFPLAPVISALIAVVVGWFCTRLVQLYFAILTLTFGQILYVIVFEAYDFTGGDNGIHGIPVPLILKDATHYYLFTLLVFAVCFVALRMIVNSSFVLTLRATRENSERAQFIGVDVRRHQLMTFIIGAFFAGIAGALMAELNRFVAPDMLYWTTSADPILASLLGGMFSLTGPLIGAAVLVFLNSFLSQYTIFWPTVLGVLTITLILIAPDGIVGLIERRFRQHFPVASSSPVWRGSPNSTDSEPGGEL